MVRANSRPCTRRLFLGLHFHSIARRSSGRNVFCQMGHLGFGDGQRRLHSPHAGGSTNQLHCRPRRAVHRRTRSCTIQFPIHSIAKLLK